MSISIVNNNPEEDNFSDNSLFNEILDFQISKLPLKLATEISKERKKIIEAINSITSITNNGIELSISTKYDSQILNRFVKNLD